MRHVTLIQLNIAPNKTCEVLFVQRKTNIKFETMYKTYSHGLLKARLHERTVHEGK